MYSKEFEAGGKSYKLKYDFNAVADIEEKAGYGIGKLISEDMIGFHFIRLFMWGGLRHQDHGITPQRAGMIVKQMLEEGYELEDVSGLVNDGLVAGGIVKVEKEDDSENPTKPEKSGSATKSKST